MATVLAAAQASSQDVATSLNEALSGVFGSISLTAWICLLLPQLIANYKAKSADALSMAFLFVWLLGDAANLSGAISTKLAPTAIALACYFCFADLVLITQCLYYNALSARRRRAGRRRRRSSVPHAGFLRHTTGDGAAAGHDGLEAEAEEEEPLLARQQRRQRRRSSSLGLPGSHRRHSVNAARRELSNLDPLTRIITGEDDTPDGNPWLHNSLSLLAVYVVGAVGWFVSYRMGAWGGASVPDGAGPSEGGAAGAGGGDGEAAVVTVFGLVMGYFSALCYLCARVPQIVKNYREKSCEGLALLFFLLSLTGNFTYGASLVAYSQDRSYLIKAIPWLLGSLGTIVEDCIIFVQFRLYAPPKPPKAATNGTA